MGIHGAANAQSLNNENFHEYLSALESVNSDVLRSRFYHRDFSISLGELTMDVDAILEYEKNLSSLVDFHFEIQQIVADETGIYGRLVPQPLEQRVVQRILREAAAGKSFRAIARGLDAAGVPCRSGLSWSHQTVGAIVRRAADKR
jgi:hypothetical protein